MKVDPITQAVVAAALASVAEEAGTALRKTAYSQAVREGRDFSVALFDARGQMIVQGDFSPGHLGSMPSLVQLRSSSLRRMRIEPSQRVRTLSRKAP